MISIEPLSEKDLPEVCRMEELVFPGSAWTNDMFRDEIRKPSSCSLLLRQEGVLIGYLVADTVKPELSLLKIAVHPDHRRKGFGSMLLSRLADQSRKEGFTKIFLEVRVSNSAARRIYQRSGFTVAGIRKSYYPDNEDALVMERTL
ncbi:MAG: ribosomal protein S18-alanine N-acetyltransferase [bacterium]|nr:ribosomal protein S18-alanine N-acetyltransferase [bacterium]